MNHDASSSSGSTALLKGIPRYGEQSRRFCRAVAAAAGDPDLSARVPMRFLSSMPRNVYHPPRIRAYHSAKDVAPTIGSMSFQFMDRIEVFLS